MQTLAFMPIPTGARDPRSAEDKLSESRRILGVYAYASIVATWDGWYEDRPGLYFVLDGSETAVRSTVDRLASGLYFVHILQDLT